MMLGHRRFGLRPGMRAAFIVERFRTIFFFLSSVIFCVIPAACSNDDVAGNSAETGSPELAGILVLDDGSPAAFAQVKCVPEGFDARYQALPQAFTAVADSAGAFAFDSLPADGFALEAFHAESGKRMLAFGLDAAARQAVPPTESGIGAVRDTLRDPGFARIDIDSVVPDGTVGEALVQGSTTLRKVTVDGGAVLVDSLPAGALDLLIAYDDANGTTASYDSLRIVPGDTLVVGDVTPDRDSVVFRFVAPVALPGGDTLPAGSVSDIPVVFRLDSSVCDFDSLVRLVGRWEVFRLSADGARSAALPISMLEADSVAKRFLFWVRMDDVDLTDSVELSFNTGLDPAYANDVFPTSRRYTAVWHFEGDADVIGDSAEKQGYDASGFGLSTTAGVVGDALLFDGEGYATVKNSAASDTARTSDLNFAYSSDFGFSVWVRMDDVESPQTLFCKGPSQYEFRFAPDSGFVVEMFHEARAVPAAGAVSAADSVALASDDTLGYRALVVSGDSLVEKGRWTFVSFGKSGDAFILFVDGVRVATSATKVPWEGSRDESLDFQIGRMYDGERASRHFVGAMDELFVYSSIRWDRWVEVTYRNQSPVQPWPEIFAR